MKDIAYQLLQPAINFGLSEAEFWDMTKAEIERYLEGAVWRLKLKAQFDYSLADLMGASIARVFSGEAEYPTLYQAYKNLFAEEAEEQMKEEAEAEALMTKSQNNFLAFAMKHNARMKKGVENLNYDI